MFYFFLLSCVAHAFDLSLIRLPPGFQIQELAKVPSARSLAVSKNGTIFVGSMEGGKIYAVARENLKTKKVFTLAKGLRKPIGVALYGDDLFFSAVDKIYRLPQAEKNLAKALEPQVIKRELPGSGHHGGRFIAFGPDKKLYVGVGVPCNVCPLTGLYGSILRMNPDGASTEIFATGVRNTVGFDWHPSTKALWFTDNGRDMMGDDIPPDELNHAPRAGMNFGFPFCHGNAIADPEFGGGKSCSSFSPPEQELGPHVAALGMRFYTGALFPQKFRNQIFIAEHGSWNRSKKIGYRVSVVTLENGRAKSYEVFAQGWLRENEKVLGRPVDVAVDLDGSLLVSDDYRGVIYRISYQPTK